MLEWLGEIPPPVGRTYCMTPKPPVEEGRVCGYPSNHDGDHGTWNADRQDWDEWPKAKDYGWK